MILKNRAGSILYTLTVLTLFSCTSSGNEGHRLGAELFKGKYTENTLESFKATLSDDVSKSRKFHYYELDIRETSDGELIIYHDRYFSRLLLANTDANRRILAQSGFFFWKRYRVRSHSLNTVQDLELKNGERIPTLAEFLGVAEQNKIKERIFIELKEPLTREGMENLYYLLSLYRFEISLSVLMYPHVFGVLKKEHSDIIQLLYSKHIYFYEVKKPKNKNYIFDLQEDDNG